MEQAARLLCQLETSTRLPRAGRVQPKLARHKRIPFPALQSNISMFIEDKKGRSVSHVGDTLLADTTVVPTGCGTRMRHTEASTAERQLVDGAARGPAPSVATTEFSTNRLAFVRRRHAEKQFPANVSNLLVDGNRSGTHKAYQSAWSSWYRWCGERSSDPVAPSLSEVLAYLTHLFELGRSYRTINLHRSMLSSTLPEIDGIVIGKHPLVCRLLRAVYNRRTPKAKYSVFWDAENVLENIKELGPNASLSLKQLTFKTVLTLALATYARVSEIASIDFGTLRFQDGELLLRLLKPRKSQTSGPLATLTIRPLLTEPLVCPVESVRAYVERTTPLREGNARELFVALKPPHTAVGASSIARWLKMALQSAGVDTAAYTAHSTRGAAASKAFAKGIPCDNILAAANWKRASTFHKFYNKRIRAGDGTGLRL